MSETETQPEVHTSETEQFIVKIPDCCTSGSPECKHVVNQDFKTKKRNIAV